MKHSSERCRVLRIVRYIIFFTLLMSTCYQAKTKSLNTASAAIYVGDTLQLKVNSKLTCKWTSSDKTVAAVGKQTGLVTGVKAGSAVITCKVSDGTKLKASIKVKNRPKPVNFTTIGHRGDTDMYPENTVISVKSAMKRGCDGAECDVWYTASGDFLVFHDSTLLRMCQSPVSIISLTKATRKQYPIISGTYTAQDALIMPTLQQVLTAINKKNGILYLHLKNPGMMDENAISSLFTVLNQYGIRDRCVVFSDNLLFMDRLNGFGYTLGYLTKVYNYNELVDIARWCSDHSVEYLYLFLADQISQPLVNAAHDMGLKIGVYKVRKKKELKLLYNLQADFAMLYHVDIIN